MPIRKPQLTEDQEEAGKLRRKFPHMLTARNTAAFIGIQPHYIGHLVRKGLLRSLGSPSGDYSFSQVEIEALATNISKLAQIKRAIEEFNADQSARKRKDGQDDD